MLDWARSKFGPLTGELNTDEDIPIFLPWINGERSLEWNPDLRPKWFGRTDKHSPAQLSRAVAEGVLFNIAQYVQTIERESGSTAEEIVLSGNGFREPLLAPMLATLLGRELILPDGAGLGTLRGTAVCAWQALGHDPMPAVERIIKKGQRVKRTPVRAVLERFERFKELRGMEGRSHRIQ